jgi:hypothetical protein
MLARQVIYHLSHSTSPRMNPFLTPAWRLEAGDLGRMGPILERFSVNKHLLSAYCVPGVGDINVLNKTERSLLLELIAE